MLTIDVEDRIRKFNMAANDILLHTSDLREGIKCGLIVKKMFTCIAIWNWWCFNY